MDPFIIPLFSKYEPSDTSTPISPEFSITELLIILEIPDNFTPALLPFIVPLFSKYASFSTNTV